jgi:hypothetical protein
VHQQLEYEMNFLKVPTATELAQRELEEAQRQLLKAQTQHEYAAAMVRFHGERIRQLQGVLANA